MDWFIINYRYDIYTVCCKKIKLFSLTMLISIYISNFGQMLGPFKGFAVRINGGLASHLDSFLLFHAWSVRMSSGFGQLFVSSRLVYPNEPRIRTTFCFFTLALSE